MRALAAVLLVAVAAPLMTAVTLSGCAGHEQGDDPMQVCYDHFLAHSKNTRADSLALAAMGAATAGRTCYTPHDKPAGLIPTWAVMRRLDGTIVGEPFDAAWAEATDGHAWTISLCA